MEPTAAEKVFAIPELLEAILLQLHPRSLRPCKRVNKTFRATIADSYHLQRLPFTAQPKPSHAKSSVASYMNENRFLLHRTIVTPEGYSFKIRIEHAPSKKRQRYSINFDFLGDGVENRPTREKPPTGSWRELRTHEWHVSFPVSLVTTSTDMTWYVEEDERGERRWVTSWYERSVGVNMLENPTLGEAMDLVMAAEARWMSIPADSHYAPRRGR